MAPSVCLTTIRHPARCCSSGSCPERRFFLDLSDRHYALDIACAHPVPASPAGAGGTPVSPSFAIWPRPGHAISRPSMNRLGHPPASPDGRRSGAARPRPWSMEWPRRCRETETLTLPISCRPVASRGLLIDPQAGRRRGGVRRFLSAGGQSGGRPRREPSRRQPSRRSRPAWASSQDVLVPGPSCAPSTVALWARSLAMSRRWPRLPRRPRLLDVT